MDAELELARLDLDKARRTLTASRLLAARGFADDALSRAYYAVFHAARAVLTLLGVKVESHGGLKTMFGLHVVRSGHVEERFGRILNKLHDFRQAGDYDALTFFEPAEVEQALDQAEDFVTRMEQVVERLDAESKGGGAP